MTLLDAVELAVVEKLIIETEDAIADISRIFPHEDDPVVGSLRNARDWLRGIRDTRMWCAPANQ